MRSLFVCVALCLPAGALAGPAPLPQRLDALVKEYARLKQFNGAALVAQQGKVVLEKGYGLANMEWGVPNAPDTRFRLGSITKQFTSMLVMQLVAEGKVALDEPMLTYLPDYRADTGRKVTVRQLLNHTSGIPSYTDLPGFFREESRNPYSVAAFIKKFASGDLTFEPGSRFAYNNSGYFLLGALIERVTGKAYEVVLQERIFGPLGMKDSGYDHTEVVLPRRAAGYELGPGGYRNAPYLDMSLPYAGGSLYSTVRDLFRWDRALAAHTLLKPELETVMFTPALEEYAFGWVRTSRPLADGKTKVEVLQHGGGINGFSTLIVRVPATQGLVVLLDNTSRGDKLGQLASGLLSILHGLEPKAPRQSLVDELVKAAEAGDVAAGIARYRALKATAGDRYEPDEGALNQYGYQLLARGRPADAVAVLRLNAEEFPGSWNAHDSLGEAYAAAGDREHAVTSYTRSLELNPSSEGGKAALAALKAPPVKVELATLEKYVGEYALGPTMVLAVTRDGERLTAQATGQPVLALTPTSPTSFKVTGVAATIDFAPDGTSLVLHQGGRDLTAKRLVR